MQLRELVSMAALGKEYLTFDEAMKYLGVKRFTFYGLTRKKTWATYCPNGKQKYVKRADLDAWIEASRVSSAAETATKASNYMLTKTK